MNAAHQGRGQPLVCHLRVPLPPGLDGAGTAQALAAGRVAAAAVTAAFAPVVEPGRTVAGLAVAAAAAHRSPVVQGLLDFRPAVLEFSGPDDFLPGVIYHRQARGSRTGVNLETELFYLLVTGWSFGIGAKAGQRNLPVGGPQDDGERVFAVDRGFPIPQHPAG